MNINDFDANATIENGILKNCKLARELTIEGVEVVCGQKTHDDMQNHRYGLDIFYNCLNRNDILEKVSIRDARTIGAKAFEHCKALNEVKLSEGLKKIDLMAFYGCDNLKEIELPESVEQINGAFGYSGSNNDNLIIKLLGGKEQLNKLTNNGEYEFVDLTFELLEGVMLGV